MFHSPCLLDHPVRGGPCGRLTGALATLALAALLGLAPGATPAAAAEHQPTQGTTAGPAHPESRAPARVTPLLADWLDLVLNPVVSAINSRQRLIQVGALMMILALAIIWWRK